MAQQFTSLEELQAYSDAQYKTILKQNEEINVFKARISELEQKIAALNSQAAANSVSVESSSQQATNEEVACVTQIYLIKNNAMTRELTTDEARRLELYVKTLQIIRNKEPAKSKSEKEAAGMSTEELIKQAEAALKS